MIRFVLAAAVVLTALVSAPTSRYPVAYEIHYTASTTTVECLLAGSTAGDNPLITSMRRTPGQDWSCAAGADDVTGGGS